MVAKGRLPREVLSSIEKETLLNASNHRGKAEVGAVLGRILGQYPDLRSEPSFVAEEASAAVNRVNKMSPAGQAKLLQERYPGTTELVQREGRTGLPPLRNAVKGKTAFRLPPEPSGFMTVGHAMAFSINSLYKEMYDGELWLRFEDTNPRKASKRYYESFRRGVKWLGIMVDHEKNVSDDVEVTYGYGRKMLEDGVAYVCSCDLERVKALRFDGKACEHRERPPPESLAIWEELVAKKHGEGKFVVRFRGEMQSLDYSLRDPNIFRVIDHPHTLTGTKYTLWPTYDLANTIEDELCGITHILRSSEFHNELQRLFRERLGLRPVEVVQFSRFNFKGTPVSKRLLRPLVEERLVSGWDDPRMPTVDGIRRRGIIPEAIRQFTLQVGYTKSEHEYDWSLLYAVNRKLLDPVTKRLFFVPDPVHLSVERAPPRSVEVRYHPDKNLGARTIEARSDFFIPRADLDSLKKGDVFRLMDLYNLTLLSKGEEPAARYAGDGLVPDTKKVQWVTEGQTEIKVLVAGPLFDETGKYDQHSLTEAHGLVENAFSQVKVGDIVQFPRFGFCRLDSRNTMVLAHK
ncbi:MAG: glutamate--tRNA ligase [Thaumarchaeota archaeon]|nr:glutamate--tRNA ligase [Nitrososphaerota archaeon]